MRITDVNHGDHGAHGAALFKMPMPVSSKIAFRKKFSVISVVDVRGHQ